MTVTWGLWEWRFFFWQDWNFQLNTGINKTFFPLGYVNTTAGKKDSIKLIYTDKVIYYICYIIVVREF